MIITQKYNSVNDIDPEFISPLEELLSEHIPNFDYIKNFEDNSNDNMHFAYFLFFGQKTNAPIGFAQLNILKKDQKNNLINKLFSKNKFIPFAKNESCVSWTIPGTLKEGIVVNPKYTKEASQKAYQIFCDYFEREDVFSQEIVFSKTYQGIDSKFIDSEKRDTTIIDNLIKNKSNYQEYLDSLSEKTKKDVLRNWQFAQRELGYKLGEYNELKEVFFYKEKGAEQHKVIKSHPKLKALHSSNNEISFLTFETGYEVKSIVLFCKGKGMHSFYDVIQLDESLPESLPHHQAILFFFELNGSERLHYLGNEYNEEYLLKLGFSYKKQFIVSRSKEK